MTKHGLTFGVEIIMDEKNIVTPKLLEINEIHNGLRYIFEMPVGITVKNIQDCKQQIKELSNAIDVEIYHKKGNIAYIDVETKDDVKLIEGSITTKKWNKFWHNTEVYVGNSNDGYKYPTLIEEKSIPGGTSYTFKMPIGKSSFHITKQDITVKEFLQARLIEVEALEDNNVVIKAIYEELPKKVPYQFLERASEGLSIPIGKTIDGYAVINFKDMANALLAGNTGSGKSITTKWMLTYLGCTYSEDELEIYIADLKKLELFRFKNMKHVKRFVDNSDDLTRMIYELNEIMEERFEKFREAGVRDIYKYNEKYPNNKMKQIILVIEEFKKYNSTLNVRYGGNKNKTNKEIEFLTTFLSQARASGINTIITIQRPTAENMHPDIKSFLGNKICFLAVNEASSLVMCDDENLLCNLRGKGHGYLISQTDAKKPRQEFQGFFIEEDDEIEKILKERGLLLENNDVYGYPKKEKKYDFYGYEIDDEYDDI